MSSSHCPLCGLRYAARPLLDLHIREDHAQRERQARRPAAADPAPGRAPDRARPLRRRPRRRRRAPGSWAETARRALNRMIGRAA